MIGYNEYMMSVQHFPIGFPGRSKLFHVECMRRIPVVQDQETRDVIGATTHEGRMFPQALSDEFGKIDSVVQVALSIRKKADHFNVEPDNENDLLIQIAVKNNTDEEKILFINVSDLLQVGSWHNFSAHFTACELVRIYKIEAGIA